MKKKSLSTLFLILIIGQVFAQGTELLTNGNFTNGTNGWWTQGATVTSDGAQITFNITNPGTNAWDVQMGQGGLTLRKGYKYTLNWRAKRESGTITIQVQLDHGSYAKIFGTQIVHYNNWYESALVYENTDSDIQGVSVNVMLGGNNSTAVFDYISLKEESLSTNDIPIVTNPGIGPVSYYGQMQAVGNRIHGSKTNTPMQVKGLSFYWSIWGGEEFWNTEAVNALVDDWKTEIIRVPMAVEFNDSETGYFGHLDPRGRDRQIRLVETLVNAAIAKDIYVIIDYHSHNAHTHTQNAKEFFGYMAKKYGSYDHVIFELYNEPIDPDWQTIKEYTEAVIDTIRLYSDNLVVVGNENYSLRPDVASASPINDPNAAYVFHIYAPYGNENDDLLARVNSALNNNKSLFVSEWGTIYSWGEKNARTDNSSFASSDFWMNILDDDMITSAYWCVLSTNMSNENPNEACLFNEEFGSISRTGVGWTDTTRMTPSGKYIFNWLKDHAQNVQWRKVIPVPYAPVLLSPVNNTQNLNLSPTFLWRKTQNADRYTFQLADNSQFNPVVLSDTSVTDTSQNISGLTEGQKYYWRVLAKNTAGLSTWSETGNFTTILSAPTNLSGQIIASNEIKLTWNDNSANEDGYIIERKSTSQNNFSLLERITDSNEYSDRSITTGETYSYRVRAYTDFTESENSNEVIIITVSINDKEIPTEYSLSQNYPNPFNPATTIKFGLPENSNVRLRIYNILGENVVTLVNEVMNPGYHEVVWNAGGLTSGIYFYELITPEYRFMKKLLLLK